MKNIKKIVVILFFIWTENNIAQEHKQTNTQSSSHPKPESKNNKNQNNQPASEEEKKTHIQDFIKSVQAIPQKTATNHKEYSAAIDNARAIYKKEMYEFSTKHPFVFTKEEYDKIKKTRKHLNELYSKLKEEDFKNGNKKPSSKLDHGQVNKKNNMPKHPENNANTTKTISQNNIKNITKKRNKWRERKKNRHQRLRRN